MKTSFAATLVALVLTVANAAAPETLAQRFSAAVAGEYHTNHRYAAFATQARKEGFVQVAKLFAAVARAEEVHRAALKAAAGAMGLEVAEPQFVETPVRPTEDNLKASLQGETEEATKLYPALLAEVKASKNSDAAVKILGFALKAETQHAQLFKAALANLGKNPEVSYHLCPQCSFLGTKAVERCPSCKGEHKSVALDE